MDPRYVANHGDVCEVNALLVPSCSPPWLSIGVPLVPQTHDVACGVGVNQWHGALVNVDEKRDFVLLEVFVMRVGRPLPCAHNLVPAVSVHGPTKENLRQFPAGRWP